MRYTTVCTLVFPSVSINIRVQAEQINPQELLNNYSFGNFFSYKQLLHHLVFHIIWITQKELVGKSTPKDVFCFMNNELGGQYHHRKELNILIGYARSWGSLQDYTLTMNAWHLHSTVKILANHLFRQIMTSWIS